nr:MAG TPA: hypothetical protein [Caudoviricetes sp.]
MCRKKIHCPLTGWQNTTPSQLPRHLIDAPTSTQHRPLYW